MFEESLRDEEARYKGYLMADSTVKHFNGQQDLGSGITGWIRNISRVYKDGLCAEQNSGLRSQGKHLRWTSDL